MANKDNYRIGPTLAGIPFSDGEEERIPLQQLSMTVSPKELRALSDYFLRAADQLESGKETTHFVFSDGRPDAQFPLNMPSEIWVHLAKFNSP